MTVNTLKKSQILDKNQKLAEINKRFSPDNGFLSGKKNADLLIELIFEYEKLLNEKSHSMSLISLIK